AGSRHSAARPELGRPSGRRKRFHCLGPLPRLGHRYGDHNRRQPWLCPEWIKYQLDQASLEVVGRLKGIRQRLTQLSDRCARDFIQRLYNLRLPSARVAKQVVELLKPEECSCQRIAENRFSELFHNNSSRSTLFEKVANGMPLTVPRTNFAPHEPKMRA